MDYVTLEVEICLVHEKGTAPNPTFMLCAEPKRDSEGRLYFKRQWIRHYNQDQYLELPNGILGCVFGEGISKDAWEELKNKAAMEGF